MARRIPWPTDERVSSAIFIYMSNLSRREFAQEFAKLLAAAGLATGLPLKAQPASPQSDARQAQAPVLEPSTSKQPSSGDRMVGIQVGAVSFVDEGIAPVLDRFQREAGINTLFLATYSYGRGIAGRQVPGQPLPDHGKQEYDTDYHGGNFARTHEQYYAHTPLKKIQAPDYGDFDVVAAIVPEAKSRGIKTFCWYEDSFRRDLEGLEPLLEVTLSGKRASTACFHNPGVQAFWQALTEDYLRSYPIDGIMWGSERQGPFGNALGASAGGARHDPLEISCFCRFCESEAKSRGIDPQRAREGYTKLAALVRDSRSGTRPADGYFVSYWRLLVQYPEILAWEKLWNDGQKNAYKNIYRLAKSIRPETAVGWHIWHNNSFSPFYRAEQDYNEFRGYSDFLKIVMYNNCGGPRLASYIDSVSHSIFADLSPDATLDLMYKDLNYKESRLSDLPHSGLSADYVDRETRRALAGVQGADKKDPADKAIKIWPGIDIDIPTGDNEKKTQPEDVRQAVRAALNAGAHGVILSRKYSEMRLANLRAAGDGLRA